MTEQSRSSEEEPDFAPVDSDGFIDAVLEQAESTVAVRRRRRMLEQRNARRDTDATVVTEAVDMIDGQVLAAPTSDKIVEIIETDEIVVDLTDGAEPTPEPGTKPVKAEPSKTELKAKPPKTKQLKAKPPKTKPVKAKQLKKPVSKRDPRPAKTEPSLVETKARPELPIAPTPEREAATAALRSAVADSTPPPDRAPAARASAPVVDFRGVVAPSAPVARRGRPLRRWRRSFREYMIRRGSGASRVPLTTRWRKARLRRTRERRRAATLAALQGQDPTEVRVNEPGMLGYIAAVAVIAALAVVLLVVLL